MSACRNISPSPLLPFNLLRGKDTADNREGGKAMNPQNRGLRNGDEGGSGGNNNNSFVRLEIEDPDKVDAGAGGKRPSKGRIEKSGISPTRVMPPTAGSIRHGRSGGINNGEGKEHGLREEGGGGDDDSDEGGVPRNLRAMSVRTRQKIKKQQAEKEAAQLFFELAWNIIAVLYLIAVLQTSSAYIPQHDFQAGSLLSQTKMILTGSPDAKSWSSATATMYNKSALIDQLNSTILEAMFKVHVTHAVFHLICAPSEYRRRSRRELLEIKKQKEKQNYWYRRFLPPVGGDQVAAAATQSAGGGGGGGGAAAADPPVHLTDATVQPKDLYGLPTGPDIIHTAACAQLPTHVPHRGGVWMYSVSMDDAENKGCPLKHSEEEPRLAQPWARSRYVINGQQDSYKIVSDCAASTSFEVMDRVDNPDRSLLNQLADWTAVNFKWNTQALIILVQLYFEPTMQYDTFGIFLVEQDPSGQLTSSSYYYARNYGPLRSYATVTTDHALTQSSKVTSFLMLLFFATWCVRLMTLTKAKKSWGYRIIFIALFLLAFLAEYTPYQPSRGMSIILALPIVIFILTLLVLTVLKRSLTYCWGDRGEEGPSGLMADDPIIQEMAKEANDDDDDWGGRDQCSDCNSYNTKKKKGEEGEVDDEESEQEQQQQHRQKEKEKMREEEEVPPDIADSDSFFKSLSARIKFDQKAWCGFGGPLLGDCVLLALVLFVCLGYHQIVELTTTRGACLIISLWLLHVFVNVVIRIRRGLSHIDGWDVVDILLISCVAWMFRSYIVFSHWASGIKDSWILSSETAAFMASKAPVMELPFSIVVFLVVLRSLRYIDVLFPILAVPWSTFTRSLKELVAYSVVFGIIMLAFSLLFMYVLGGETAGLSGIATSFMTMLPAVFEGNLTSYITGSASKNTMVVLINLFYAFAIVFFVANILLAIVLDHYNQARSESEGVWCDKNLANFMARQIRSTKKLLPYSTHKHLDDLERRLTITDGTYVDQRSYVSSGQEGQDGWAKAGLNSRPVLFRNDSSRERSTVFSRYIRSHGESAFTLDRTATGQQALLDAMQDERIMLVRALSALERTEGRLKQVEKALNAKGVRIEGFHNSSNSNWEVDDEVKESPSS